MSSSSTLKTPLPVDRPSSRPDHYPVSVLWLFDDAKRDPPRSHVQRQQVLTPPMRDIIRHPNGDLITLNKWKAICQSTITVIRQCLDILGVSHLPISAISATKAPCKKFFYRRYFFVEWSKALRELKYLQPLLSPCSGVWKVDKLVGVILQDHKLIPQQTSRPPSHASRPPSHASRPHSRASSVNSSSLSHPHSCPSTPGLAPPSSIVGSSRGVTSSSSSTSPASRQPRQSPRRVILNRSSVRPHPVSGTKEPAAASKSVVSKGKCRREPSPVVTEKKTKANEDKDSHSGVSLCHSYSHIQLTSYNSDATGSQSSPSHPTFLKLVQSGTTVSFFLVFIPSLI